LVEITGGSGGGDFGVLPGGVRCGNPVEGALILRLRQQEIRFGSTIGGVSLTNGVAKLRGKRHGSLRVDDCLIRKFVLLEASANGKGELVFDGGDARG
jgi:hypothetical protein